MENEEKTHEHNGHRSRVRDRVRKEGLDNFQDYQVLEYALTFVLPYRDTNPLAHRLINKFGSFAGVLEADEDDLKRVKGVGDATAHFLANILKVFNYYKKDKVKKVAEINTPDECFEFVKPLLTNKLVEEMYMICLSPKNKVVSVEKVAKGSSSEASVPMRLITDKMARAKVSNIIVAHNHPKGMSLPSIDDNQFTKALVASLCINGCHLLDHVIVGEDEEYFSYKRAGLVEKYTKLVVAQYGVSNVSQPRAKYGEESSNDKE